MSNLRERQMTLFRTNEPYAEEIHELIDSGFLIQVESCEHGNYARHPVIDSKPPYDLDFWCPGAGIGGDE